MKLRNLLILCALVPMITILLREEAGQANSIDPGKLPGLLATVEVVPFELTGLLETTELDGQVESSFGNASRGGQPIAADEMIARSQNDHSSIQLLRSDCALSCCVLSQIVNAIVARASSDDPRLVELVVEVRRKHLATMLDCLEPGGTGLLIVDFVSSETLPEMVHTPSPELPQLLHLAIEQGNFFTGCNPIAILQQLRQMQTVGRLHRVGWGKPWLWRIASKHMAVCPLWFVKQ